MTSSKDAGLTIVEVVIAMVILAVGVLGAFAMQSSSLQGTAAATVTQELSNIALSEVDLQRAFRRQVLQLSPSPIPCRTEFEQPAYTCTFTLRPCVLVGIGEVECTDGPVDASDAEQMRNLVGRQITVNVAGPGGRRVELSTVAR